ncbi:MAG: NADH-quinone oxidoreductase subunit A [Candidatus Micrarchaeota archaeon]|nr:NADH-quinone oxidoreductase subunit A [Candidatus Micrarchaeota archaeon]
MAFTYATLAVFALLAVFVPISMLLLSKTLGPRTKQNPIKLETYESAEFPIGTHKDVTNDYLHYFPLYLGFEIVVVILFAWIIVSGDVGKGIGLALIGVSFGAFILSSIGIIIAKTQDKVDLYGGKAVY